jgi:3-hydroxyisobutyrate dehydrogenase-like beta-hydroxyacid dehydrogenase
MSIETVAVLSPGDMGHAVGRALGKHGLRVITCLAGRSQRTAGLAQQAGIEDVPTLEEVVRQADLVLSILVPAQASGLAQQVAEALKATGEDTLYADCNAVSPKTAQEIGDVITKAGGRFIDAGIVGGPPSDTESPRIYVSGLNSEVMAELNGKGIQVRPIGYDIGRASGLKMCYAAMTKGTSALQLAILTTAERLGLTDELCAEWEGSQAEALKRMNAQVPRLPVTARRWTGEMEEIAATFEQVGVTPHFHLGAAEMYRVLGLTTMADDTPETLDRSRTREQAIAALAKAIGEAS